MSDPRPDHPRARPGDVQNAWDRHEPLKPSRTAPVHPRPSDHSHDALACSSLPTPLPQHTTATTTRAGHAPTYLRLAGLAARAPTDLDLSASVPPPSSFAGTATATSPARVRYHMNRAAMSWPPGLGGVSAPPSGCTWLGQAQWECFCPVIAVVKLPIAVRCAARRVRLKLQRRICINIGSH